MSHPQTDPYVDVLEQAVRDALAPLALALGALFAGLVLLATTPLYSPGLVLRATHLITACVFLAVGGWWRGHPPRQEYSMHLLGGVGSWMTLVMVVIFLVDPHPREVSFQHLLVLADGLVLVSSRWFAANMIAIHLNYILAIVRSDSVDEWRLSIVTVSVTLGTAIVLHLGRRVYHRRIVGLTLESEKRRRKAEEDMEALAQQIKEQSQLQERLLQAQKLESLGRLAGGIAHDFNNLLVPVVGNAELLLLEMNPSDERYSYVQDIAAAGERAGILTDQLLAYAGRGVMTAVSVDLGKEVRELGQLVASSLPRNTQLVLDVDRELPGVKADRAQLQQILTNLILNAGEASPRSGARVTVTTGVRELSQEEARALAPSQDRAAGRYVFLQVADQGEGMDEETLSRMYDPFFSTRSRRRGLGLTAVLGIARRHGGGIQVHSHPGEGSRFCVFLPVAAGLDSVSKPPSTTSRLRGRVLVVDDEDAVRRTARRYLEGVGLAVDEAVDGWSALGRVQEDAGFDLVVLDMRMPGMSGEETFRGLRRMQPELPVLICSGYEREVAIGQLREEPAVDFLAKPYRLDDLKRQVETLLGGEGKRQLGGPDSGRTG